MSAPPLFSHTGRRLLAAAVGAAAAVSTVALTPAPAAAAASPGDASRFDTWTGYSVGRFTHDVVATDLNGDSLADAVWLRDEWFEPTFSVQLNLGDGTLGRITRVPVTAQPNDIDAGDLDEIGRAS